MTTITCDKCKNVLHKDDSRLGGEIAWIHNEERSRAISLVYSKLDFCSVECLSGFIHIKLKEFDVSVKS